MTKNLLVTGAAGFVGSVLTTSLVEKNYHIKCLDRFFFGDEYLSQKKFFNNVELICDDIRWFDSSILKDVDIVLDLAALSNDPVGELNPEKTYEINYKGRSRVASLCKDIGVPQYILASSASVYGQQNSIVDENSTVNPLTAYSKANRLAEIDVLKLNDKDFSTTVLRFSSIYGLSPRMRFDLAVNSLVLDFFNTGKISVHGKSNTRPFLHIKDAVRAYHLAIEAKKDLISGEILNVGSDTQNYSILNLAKEVGDSITDNYVLEAKDTPDNRSYSASFAKIKDTLDFETKYSVSQGSIEIFKSLKEGTLKFNKKMITLQWYKHILSDPELNKKLSINGKVF